MLVISKSTVKTHLSHIYEKTGVRTKEQLIQLAGTDDLIPNPAAQAGNGAKTMS